ncbi:hypothetical protein [Dactylosporangium sp. NPDC051484]|uniref:hypothetical protein n=1 Tax=Dactylosporangium sp. NPDC051484 TaxID=3154942 RepID=UPI00344CE958
MQLRNGYLGASGERVVGVDVGEFVAGEPVEDFFASSARFERCTFRGLRVEEFSAGEGTPASEYVDCVFDGLRADLLNGRARFVRCSFRDIHIGRVIGRSMSMVDCVWTGVLEEAEFRGRDVGGDGEENEFTGNDFSGADLQQVSFRFGIDLSAQRLPDGPEYVYVSDLRAALTAAREAANAYPPQQLVNAEELISLWARDLEFGQRQLLLRRSLWGTDDAGRDLLDLFGTMR